MKFPRSSGILLHPTSLPGPAGIGTLGPDAVGFASFLKDAGCSIWQMLPLGPTGYGDSPYQCFSAFAGNPLLIHLPDERDASPLIADVDFGSVISQKRALLLRHFDRFVPDTRYEKWVKQQAWLDDYALFSTIKDVHDGQSWTTWEAPLATRDPLAIEKFRQAHTREMAQVCFEQYVFFRQFAVLRSACRERGIRLMGDLPIYVAHDSADVWANRELFQLHPDGSLVVQAGVPPDYFSETGQLWGNPIYNWRTLHDQKYTWWIRRMRAALSMFDMVRLDHFRGFESYWEVPGTAETAVNGKWVPGPGAELFRALTSALGPLPIVAENLGLITPEVEALRKQLGYPGMSILQFAFGGDGEKNEFKPHHYIHEQVVYTGTHDNDTTVGWWSASAGGDSTRSVVDVEKEQRDAREYLDTDGTEMHWTLIRAAMASVADTALVPMQDVLGLGSESRMNLPGRQSGNWKFRFRWEQLAPDMTRRLFALNRMFDRLITRPASR
jgi:4-alpha-glucanotransferase